MLSIIAIGLLALILLPFVAPLFMAPPEVRSARDLYNQGQYQQAYAAINSYIDTHTEEALKKIPETDQNKKLVFMAFGLGDSKAKVEVYKLVSPHPEAFLLKGEIEFLHRLEAGLGATTGVNEAVESFTVMLALAPGYRQSLIGVMNTAISEMSAEKIAERARKHCLPHIQKHDYVAAYKVRQAALACTLSVESSARDVLQVLDSVDKSAAAAIAKKLPATVPENLTVSQMYDQATADAARARSTAANNARCKNLLPLLDAPTVSPVLESLKLLTESQAQSMAKDAHGLPFWSLLHLRFCKELTPDAIALFSELARYIGTPEGRRCESIFVDQVVVHAEKLLPVLLERVEMDRDMAFNLLKATGEAGASDPNVVYLSEDVLQALHVPEVDLNEGLLKGEVAGGCGEYLNEECAATVKTALRRGFVAAVTAHADRAPDEDFSAFCNKKWPGSTGLDEIASELAELMRARLRDDDEFYFAIAWSNAQFRRKNSGHRRYSLNRYVEKFPEGRHVGVAKGLLSRSAEVTDWERYVADPRMYADPVGGDGVPLEEWIDLLKSVDFAQDRETGQ